MSNSKTARELLNELEQDPTFQKIKERKDAKIQKLQNEVAKDEEVLVYELNLELQKIGCKVTSVWDLVNSFNKYQIVYPILKKHLSISHHIRVYEGIIRALTVKGVGNDVEASLLERFNVEQNPELKWVLANALKTVLSGKSLNNYPDINQVYHNKI